MFSFDPYHQYATRSWCRFARDERVTQWIQEVSPLATKAMDEPKNSPWIRCKGTWFVGVNALPNDHNAAIEQGKPLRGDVVDFLNNTLNFKPIHWDRAQISVCYPGYPQPNDNESDAAFHYRLKRDAAHVDGLLPEGPSRRRHLRELHGFILGIPMTPMNEAHAAPVVWEGSHHIVRAHLEHCYRNIPPRRWSDVDVTEAYHQARKAVFSRCRRVPLVAQPGETFILHRLSVHGISPWSQAAQNPSQATPYRMVCYFRPYLESPVAWLSGEV